MLTISDEINRLRNLYAMKGVPDDFINGISEEIDQTIRSEIYDVLDFAMQRAHEAGEDYRLEDFMNELTAVRIGDSYNITTDSGKTDFSTPPFPMLPKLLKNAKIAKDGSRYKVIPLSGKGTPGLTTQKAMGDLNRARHEMKELRGHKKRDPSDKGETFIGMYGKQRSKHKDDIQKNHVYSNTQFRTVTSKQDANTQWVHPGKSGDMSDILKEINNDLQQQVQDIIQSVITQYEKAI